MAVRKTKKPTEADVVQSGQELLATMLDADVRRITDQLSDESFAENYVSSVGRKRRLNALKKAIEKATS